MGKSTGNAGGNGGNPFPWIIAAAVGGVALKQGGDLAAKEYENQLLYDHIHNVAAEVVDLKAQIEWWTNEYNQLAVNRDSWMNAHKSVVDQGVVKDREIIRLQGEVDKLMDLGRRRGRRIASLEIENTDLRNAGTNKDAEISALKKRVAELEKQAPPPPTTTT
jgi:predicted  nucleic acid-binding Zn-ribbon protein